MQYLILTRITSLLFILFLGSAQVFGQEFNGFALFNQPRGNSVLMVDKDGEIAHQWNSSIGGNYSVLLKDNGNIIRGGVYSRNILNGAAGSGIVQEINPDSEIVWEFIYSDENHCSHHDMTLLPNGNVILTAWEVKTVEELREAGYANPQIDLWATHFIEVQQDGTGGKIVWEWHMWDHMIQDLDSTKENFGSLVDHPELFDINTIPSPSRPRGGDWFHVNGVSYNEVLDQLVFSSRASSEIYIIDHSTTTEEAAGHTGGLSKKGGDILYRWGNPANYNASGPRTIPAAVHDPRWITDDGRPNGGYIEFFNNEGISRSQSTVDAINPVRNGYNYEMNGDYYGPDAHEWRHECISSSSGQSAHNRMSNGNTFVNVSRRYMYEVDSLDNVVWQYAEGPSKAFRYECDHPGVHVIFNGAPCTTVSTGDIQANNVLVHPNPSTGMFRLSGVEDSDLQLTKVFDINGVYLFSDYDDMIDMSDYQPGNYIMSIMLENQAPIIKKITIINSY